MMARSHRFLSPAAPVRFSQSKNATPHSGSGQACGRASKKNQARVVNSGVPVPHEERQADVEDEHVARVQARRRHRHLVAPHRALALAVQQPRRVRVAVDVREARRDATRLVLEARLLEVREEELASHPTRVAVAVAVAVAVVATAHTRTTPTKKGYTSLLDKTMHDAEEARAKKTRSPRDALSEPSHSRYWTGPPPIDSSSSTVR